MSHFSANHSYQYAVQTFFWYSSQLDNITSGKEKKMLFYKRGKSESGYPSRNKQMKSNYYWQRIIDVILRMAPSKQKTA